MQFVKGLRNYVQHADVPVLKVHLFEEPGLRRVYLHSERLLEREKAWNPLSRSFLEGQQDGVDIARWIEEYMTRGREVFGHLRGGCLRYRRTELRALYDRYKQAIGDAEAEGASFEDVLVKRLL